MMRYNEEKSKIIKEFIKNGLDKKQAEIIADVMVTADAYGVTSHGTEILEAHIQRLNNGGYNLNPKFKILQETPAFSVIDGDNAIGFISADYCMRYAINKAKITGIYHVFSRNNNTLGPAFYYALKAAEQGIIGIVFSNSPAQMAPFGGKEKMLGTNPFSVVIPVPRRDPIIIDMATSIVAKSKFKQYKEEGKRLPDGWAVDIEGNPTNDPDEGIQGMVLPMAGFKGYGIAMFIDILTGLLSGAATLNKVGRFYDKKNISMNVGYTCIAINPKIILGESYDKVICEYVDLLRNSKSIVGKKIILPGDDRITYFKDKKL